MSAPEPPRKLGKYEVLEKLGEGGQGIVFRVRNPDLNRIEALKILRGTARVSNDDQR